MVSNTAVIEGSSVQYWIHNPRLKSTVVAVHGFRGNHKALTAFARGLQDQRVVLFDLPGYGVSAPMRRTHTLKNYAKFLSAFIDETLKVKRFVLWGHSYGGTICIEYAALRPERLQALVLVSPAISSDGVMANLGAAYYRSTRLLPAPWQKAWLASPVIDHIAGELLIKQVSNRRKLELQAAGRRNLQETNPKVIVESSLSFFKTDVIKCASKIRTPTLIIAGYVDEIVPLSRINQLAGVIPGARLQVLPRQGHLAPLERPLHVARLTRDFIG